MDVTKELSFDELSVIFSNLAKACEKQYRLEESDLFNKLANYYNAQSEPIEGKSLQDIQSLIRKDLDLSYPEATNIASQEGDRGALRAITWGEKVTKILNSIISRYEKQNDALLQNTYLYVCEICGFLYLGNEPPDICPVCKVPKIKLSRVQRGVA